MAILTLQKPEAGQHLTVTAAKNTNLELAFSPADATLTREGDNLIFVFTDGSKIEVESFYATITRDTLPDFVIEGQTISGEDFFAALSEDLMPAAGPTAAMVQGGRFNQFDNADLLHGLDRLNGLDLGFDGNAVPEDRENAGGWLGAIGAAADTADTADTAGVSGTETDVPPLKAPGLVSVSADDKNLTVRADSDGSTITTTGTLLVSAEDGLKSVEVTSDGWTRGEGNTYTNATTGETITLIPPTTEGGDWGYAYTRPVNPSNKNSYDSSTLTVTVTDKDGDTQSDRFTISVTDEGVSAEGDSKILSSDDITDGKYSTAGTVTISAPDGLISVDINGFTKTDNGDGMYTFNNEATGETVTLTPAMGNDWSYTYEKPASGAPENVFGTSSFVITATDKDGDTAPATVEVTVQEMTKAQVMVTNAEVLEGDTLTFNVTLSAPHYDATDVEWTITLPQEASFGRMSYNDLDESKFNELGITVTTDNFNNTYILSGKTSIPAGGDAQITLPTSTDNKLERNETLDLAVSTKHFGNATAVGTIVDTLQLTPGKWMEQNGAEKYTTYKVGEGFTSNALVEYKGNEGTFSVDEHGNLMFTPHAAFINTLGIGQVITLHLTPTVGGEPVKIENLTFMGNNTNADKLTIGKFEHNDNNTTISAANDATGTDYNAEIRVGDFSYGGGSSNNSSVLQLGLGDDIVNVTSMGSHTVIRADEGNDTITVGKTTGKILIDGGIGDDTITIGSMTQRDGALYGTVYGNAGKDTITVGTMSGGAIWADVDITNKATGDTDTITITNLAGGDVRGEGQLTKGSTGGADTISIGTMIAGNVQGEANLFDSSRGGDDTITIDDLSHGNVMGEADLAGGSTGGDDSITIGVMSGGTVMGESNLDASTGGNDTIIIEEHVESGKINILGEVDLFNGSTGGTDHIEIQSGTMRAGGTVTGEGNLFGISQGGDDTIIVKDMSGGALLGEGRDYELPSAVWELSDAMLQKYRDAMGNKDLQRGTTILAGLYGGSFGGSDTISVTGEMSGGAIYGDGQVIQGNSHGGDDTINIATMTGGEIYGDARTIEDGSTGGNDTISVKLFDVAEGDTAFIDGSLGNDVFIYDNATDHTGNTIRLDDAGNVTITDVHNVTITGFEGIGGGSGNDTLIGNDANNQLFGGAGDDILYGEGGNDFLFGGEGSNTLYGGAGNDVLVWSGQNALMDGGEGTDYLVGLNRSLLEGEDPLSLDDLLGNADNIQDIEVLVFNGGTSADMSGYKSLTDMGIAKADGSLNLTGWSATEQTVSLNGQDYTVFNHGDSGSDGGEDALQIAVLKTLVEHGV